MLVLSISRKKEVQLKNKQELFTAGP